MAVELYQQQVSRFKRGVFPVDYLVLIFSALAAIISLIFYNILGQPLLFIFFDIGLFSLLYFLIVYEKRDFNTTGYWLHCWLPIISVAVFYTQATSYDNLIFKETFDPPLLYWDRNLFGNLSQMDSFPGNHLLFDELMHIFYFSYYMILFIPGMIMLSLRSPKAHELCFSLTLMLVVHFIFFILFPSDGPIANHSMIFKKGFISIPMMNFIYKIGGKQGGGAFPSTHVAVTVLIFLYSYSELKKYRPLMIFIATGITIATVYCSYHYTIDALAGLINGLLFYFIGKWIYVNWDHPAELPDESLFHQ
ncbi:MAG: phosphatase PAP2 family protein [Candidatus Marinimicrobia bacterium]|nr:phosphatase PAP2 family protein [Candidatus Neomarinimicrobiota bacterium]